MCIKLFEDIFNVCNLFEIILLSLIKRYNIDLEFSMNLLYINVYVLFKLKYLIEKLFLCFKCIVSEFYISYDK